MIRSLTILLAVVVVAASAGVAEARAGKRPFRVSDYPLEVRKTLSVGPTTCREVEGGGKVGFARDTVRRVDFNGDGRLDYVVSFEHTTCGGERTGGFCGSGGCLVDFLVRMPNGRLRSVFVGQIHDYKILRGSPRKVRFEIFHNYCGNRPDYDKGCHRDVRIGYRRFDPVY